MSVSILNTTSGISGKNVVVAEGPATITGLHSYSRGGSAPFAVNAGAAVVANLDADKLDGVEAAAFLLLAGGTLTGDLKFTDALYDIGKAGATRPRDGFFSRNLTVGTALFVGSSAFGKFAAPSDGVVTLTNNGGTSFSKLQFGGTTASFPALRRTGATLEIILADDSAYASFVGGIAAVAALGITNAGAEHHTGRIAPAQITANQNNYNPTGLSTARTMTINSDASRDITGLAAQADGRVITIINNGSQNIVFKNQNGGSSAANQFACPGAVDFTLNQFDTAELEYIASAWYVKGF